MSERAVYRGVVERRGAPLGTPRLLTDASGRAVWLWDGGAFGGGLPEEDPDGDGTAVSFNLRYPGQYYDAETGLHYNWHRYYDPKTGRYLTPDPIGLAGGLARYVYANGNPVMNMDWDGRAVPVIPVIGCLLMGGISIASSIMNETEHGGIAFILSCATGALGVSGRAASTTASIARSAANMCISAGTVGLPAVIDGWFGTEKERE